MKSITPAAALIAVLLGCSVFANDPLPEAKQLYDSAEYDKVLSLLNGLQNGATGLRIELREYRALSLLALSRTVEAEQEIATMFELDPLYAAAASTPPRWKTTVDRVRVRVWPEIVRRRYDAAKQRFDAKEFARAVPELEALKTLLAAARQNGLQGLDDLATLTDGFLQLSREALTPSAPAQVEATKVAPAVDVQAPVVKPPAAIRRDFPAWDRPASARDATYEGRIAVVVGIDGSVRSARMVDSVHPTYDGVLMSGARRWRFEPATINGQPIEQEIEVRVVLNSASAGNR